uniref:Rx N-terminal domain-containing protein n=1 Tax=Fagus sylvatica TaxID=28930 RepID=A0A2N9IXM8_FAGSY
MHRHGVKLELLLVGIFEAVLDVLGQADKVLDSTCDAIGSGRVRAIEKLQRLHEEEEEEEDNKLLKHYCLGAAKEVKTVAAACFCS